MKLVFFGTMLPLTERLASASTGMAILLSRNPHIESIHIYCQAGGKAPKGANSDKICLREPWQIDSPISLIKAMFHVAHEGDADAFFFNQSLTMFGRKKLTNVMGLLIPTIVSKLTRKPVVVYMHNFIETEETKKLGYEPGILSRVTASFLEKLLVDNTTLIAPRSDQRTILEHKYKKPVKALLVPYVEGIQGLVNSEAQDRQSPRNDARVNVLLFGRWGPQKDLRGGLKMLAALVTAGCDISVTVAGDANSNFPEYEAIMPALLREFPSDRLSYIRDVPEEHVPELFRRSDILFLPYLASGGYSGVMNLGALYGLKIIAYDNPQLRENDALVGASTLFVSHDDMKSINDMRNAISEARIAVRIEQTDLNHKLSASMKAMDEIVKYLMTLHQRGKSRPDNSAAVQSID